MKLVILSSFVSLTLGLGATAAVASPARSGGPIEGSGAFFEPLVTPGPVGLTKFSFKGLGGDHPISQLGVLVGLDFVAGWFSGGAPSSSEVDFVHNPLPAGAVVATARRTQCQGTCDVGIPKPVGGGVFVLTGFSVDTRGGAAIPVRRLAVEPDPQDGRVRVTLAGPKAVEFDALVQYAYVPAKSVVGGRAYQRKKANPTGGKRTKLVFPELSDAGGAPLLQGFALEWTNGARELHTVAVSLIRDTAVVLFNDQAGDDPYTATVTALRLHAAP